MDEHKEMIELEDILFENEKVQAMINCVQMLITGEVVEVRGILENSVNYTLYTAMDMLQSNNKRLLEVVNRKSNRGTQGTFDRSEEKWQGKNKREKINYLCKLIEELDEEPLTRIIFLIRGMVGKE